jgi:hypothetical protein
MELEGSCFNSKIHGAGREHLKSRKWDYFYNYIITFIKSMTMLLKSVPRNLNVLFLGSYPVDVPKYYLYAMKG